MPSSTWLTNRIYFQILYFFVIKLSVTFFYCTLVILFLKLRKHWLVTNKISSLSKQCNSSQVPQRVLTMRSSFIFCFYGSSKHMDPVLNLVTIPFGNEKMACCGLCLFTLTQAFQIRLWCIFQCSMSINLMIQFKLLYRVHANKNHT